LLFAKAYVKIRKKIGKTQEVSINGKLQAGVYRFPTCSFILTLVNALKCLILQALRAFLI